MKSILLSLALCLGGFVISAQAQVKAVKMDASPADISYFSTDDQGVVARVVYSRPQKKGREVFGGLVPYGDVWRTGANEATTITFTQDVTFGGEEIKAGTYALFTQPEKDEWTIILNSEPYQWGAYRMDAEKNVLTTTVKTSASDKPIEAFTITFKNVKGGAHLMMGWDDTYVEVPVML